MKVLISPTEHDVSDLFGSDGITSAEPEERGADVLAFTKHGTLGIQRKKVPSDLILSAEDGRLTRELALIKNCNFSRLILEGKPTIWFDGTITLGYHMVKGKRERIKSHYTQKHLDGMENDIGFVHGIQITHTENTEDTVRVIRQWISFLNDPGARTGFYKRPNVKSTWIGAPTQNDLYRWILQSFPGIGVAAAESILNHFGGKIPLQWTCSLQEIMQVSKLTKKAASNMFSILNTGMKMSNEPATVKEELYEPSYFESLRAKLRGKID